MSENYANPSAQPTNTERQLLVKILNAIISTAGGGGGTNGGLQGGYGNYGGAAPGWTPPNGTLGIAVDTSNNRLWLWYGAWN